MTAPVVSPDTPVETAADSLENAITSSFGTTMVESGTPEGELARDEKGRFVPREAKEEEPAVQGEGQPVVPGEKAELAKGQVAESVVLEAADPADLVTTFTLKDATGELAIPKGLTVEFRANGKMRAEPLDRVVKFAEMGVYNHDREQRFQQITARADQTEQQVAQVTERLTLREQQLERLLSDEGFRQRALEEFQQQQTPEKQEERLRAERELLAVDRERAEIDRIGGPYYEQEIVPSLEMVATARPNVSREELIGKLKGFTDRLIDRRTGRIHPQHHETIRQHFLSEIVPWATQLDEYRAFERGVKSGKQLAAEQVKTTSTSDKEKEALQLRAQRARNAASANLRPPGKVAASDRTPKSILTAKSTHEERMNDVVSSTLASIGLGS